MTYFPDLAPCTYFDARLADKLVAVGWLDDKHPYTQGKVDVDFVDKLIELLVEPWAPGYLLGYDECPFCPESYTLTHKDTEIRVGALNLFVPGEGFLYMMPSLAAHYILAHGYAPPAEFRAAVLRCPPMGSIAYFQAIAANAPQKYADQVRARHLNGT